MKTTEQVATVKRDGITIYLYKHIVRTAVYVN